MAQSARGAALRLSWRRCGDDGHWCSFFDLNLDGDSLAKGGIYVIWAEDADGSRKKTVYVGQGKPVADCIARHRKEAVITRHQRSGRVLRVTWAAVKKEHGEAWSISSHGRSSRSRGTGGQTTTRSR